MRPTEALRRELRPPRYLPVCPTARTRCPVACCRYHERLAPTGCTLDVAAMGPLGHNDVAAVLGISGTRVQQIESVALEKVRARAARFGLEQLTWSALEFETVPA